MKGKFSTKTILISILTVILLAVAITGTVLFLKDSGKASAAQEDKKAQESQEVTLPVTGTDKQNEENTLPTTEENNAETNQEANQGRINEEVQNNNTQTNSNVQTERRTSENNSTNRVQGEQEFFTYRDKLVSEDFLVGWTPITVKALIQTSENELNVPELKINKKSYTEADIIYKDEGIVFPEETRYTYTRPEEKIFYEINVANISKIDAKNIRVYDTIPEGTTLFQKPENAEFENGKLTWTINIPAETEVSLRFIVTVNKEKTSGTIRNFAIVNGDKTNETENPVITYKKSVKQTEPLHEEEIIDYTISITNTGEVDTIIKQVEDTIPDGITYKPNSASHSGNYNEEDRKITWYDIPLLRNETVEITFKATVDKLPAGIYGKTIENIAIVDGDNTNEVINHVVKPHITRLKENNPVEAENLHEGDTITYKITAGNDGTEAKTIKIEDEAPEGTTLKEIITAGGSKVGEKGVVWENVTLNPGDSKTFEFSVTVNNLLEKEYGNTIKNTAKVDEEDTNEVTNKVVKPHITRLKENNPVEAENLHEGDTITYKITAGNDGTEAKTIKIEDEAPEGTTLKEIITAGGSKVGEKGVVWENVTLNPGDSKTFEFSVTVNNLLEKEYGNTIKNTAKVDEEDTNEVTNKVVKPHITRLKENNPVEAENLHEGDTITYKITAGNDGTEAKTIKIEDEAPEGTTLKEIITAGGSKVGEKGIVWENITLNPGDSRTFKFSVTVNNLARKEYGATIKNTAKVDGEDTNEVINHVIKPHITRSKIAWPLFGKLHEDDEITYMIFAGNNGTETKIIDISDEIPLGTTYVQNTADNGGVYVSGKKSKIIWKNVTLAPNDVKMFTFKVKINKLPEGVYEATIKNIAIVDGENTNEVNHEVVKPHITRLKANNPVETENLHEGDTITYTITAGNDGTEAKIIKIEDEAPEGTTLKEIITAGGSKVGEKGVVWENVTLNPGDSRTFEFSVTVNNLPEKEYGKTIKNTAKVDGKDTNEVTNHVVKPHITAEKVSNPKTGSTVKYGEIITYIIKVKNDGTETKTVDITDNIPLNTEFDSVQDQGTTITNNGKVTGVKWTKTIPANTTTPITVSFKVKVTGNVAQKIENKAIVDNEETNKTEHEIVKQIAVEASNNPGKNIVIILDLSSSMIKVPTEGLDKSEYRYENEYGNTALKYVYAKDRAGSIERSNSNLAKAKIALKRFAEEVLKNSSSDNKITLISFNYQSYDQAKAAIQKEPNWYHDRFEDLKAHNEIHPYVGVRTIVETKNYNEFVNKVDNIRIRAEYLLTNMVAGIKAAESKVADLKAEGKDIDVIFFGDGKPSLPTEYGAKVGFYDKDTTYSKIKESGENIRKNGAKLYTLEFLVTEKPEYTAIAKEAFKNMTGGVKTQDNKTRFSANTENVTNKLIELARTVDSNKNDNIATDKNGFATIKIPTGKELRISEKTKVQLYVSGSLVGEYDTIDKINNSGKLTYNNAEKCFRIDAKKYEAGSSIELKYYFK